MKKKLKHLIQKISILLVSISLLICCSPKLFKEKWTTTEAPQTFKARFETTKGIFDIEAHREWSPKAVDRLYQLISTDFYTDIALFRVVPKFVVQFGIHNDSTLNKSWKKYKIQDEPVIKKNLEGYIAYARDGKDTRTTQIFINLKSNSPRLDTINYNNVKGFPVIAKVTSGMEVIKSFYSDYKEEPSRWQDSIEKLSSSNKCNR